MNKSKTLNIRLSNLKNQIKTIDEHVRSLSKQRAEILEEVKQLEARLKNESKNNASNGSSQFDRADYPWSERAQELLEAKFHLQQFRSHQLAAINATLCGYDVLLIMPTGGGKSLCFQLPAILQKGKICLFLFLFVIDCSVMIRCYFGCLSSDLIDGRPT